jgi:hypothetical protein
MRAVIRPGRVSEATPETSNMERLSVWTKAEHSAGQKVAAAWEDFFKGKQGDIIERAEEIEATAKIVEVQDKHEQELLRLDNVVGVAASLKVKGDKPTKKWCLAVLVEKKLPLAEVPKASRIPAEIDGVPTDVVEVGKLEPLVFMRGCARPCPASASATTISRPAPSAAWSATSDAAAARSRRIATAMASARNARATI